jgi:hypothetical protein
VGAATPSLVATINREVLAAGGRIYLAKDEFSEAADFAAMEGARLAAFLEVKRRWDPADRIRSRQAERLGLVGGLAPADVAERPARTVAGAARAVQGHA